MQQTQKSQQFLASHVTVEAPVTEHSSTRFMRLSVLMLRGGNNSPICRWAGPIQNCTLSTPRPAAPGDRGAADTAVPGSRTPRHCTAHVGLRCEQDKHSDLLKV